MQFLKDCFQLIPHKIFHKPSPRKIQDFPPNFLVNKFFLNGNLLTRKLGGKSCILSGACAEKEHVVTRGFNAEYIKKDDSNSDL